MISVRFLCHPVPVYMDDAEPALMGITAAVLKDTWEISMCHAVDCKVPYITHKLAFQTVFSKYPSFVSAVHKTSMSVCPIHVFMVVDA